MERHGTRRPRSVERELERLTAGLDQRLRTVTAAAEAQQALAASRAQVVDLCREVDRLQSELAESHGERRRLRRLLQRTQAVARNYAEDLDAAERHRLASGWWPRLSAVLGRRRAPPEPVHESRPGAMA